MNRVRRSLFTRLGHESIETTQIYLHVMQKPGLGVKSPFDMLGASDALAKGAEESG